jgi:hypothetical protein
MNTIQIKSTTQYVRVNTFTFHQVKNVPFQHLAGILAFSKKNFIAKKNKNKINTEEQFVVQDVMN